jgi:flagellar export protein FliJ
MKAVKGLIRLHRWQLDEKRRNLADLERMKEEFERQVERLEAEIAAEQKVASDVEARFAYGAYAQTTVRRRATLQRSIADLNSQILAAREEVAAAFQEVKKYELLQEQRDRRIREWTTRREQSIQDEVAIQGYRRRQGGD